jgi:capsular exopolysaccharide synthesis family protein
MPVSRIRQILSKADHDGTTAGLTWPGSRGRSAPPPQLDAEPEPEPAPVESRTALDGAPFTLVEAKGSAIPGRLLSGAALHRQLVAGLQPSSPAAAQYRTLYRSITKLEGASPRHVVAVTSAGRGDGKTLTGINLALTMAQDTDNGTLLIDAHLRRPRVHALLGIAQEPGLVDILIGRTPVDAALVALTDHRLHVLTAGAHHPQRSELLGSAEMHRLIEGLRQQFDRIVIDAGSAESAEAVAMGRWVDGVLLVVRAGRTKRPDIDRAISSVPASKLMGMVLNDSDSIDEPQGA